MSVMYYSVGFDGLVDREPANPRGADSNPGQTSRRNVIRLLEHINKKNFTGTNFVDIV